MPLNLGDVFPNFEASVFNNGKEQKIKFHDWQGDSKWAILFSHPKDYTPVCTTELGRVTTLVGEFEKRNCKMMALSCDSVEDHKGWTKDIMDYQGQADKTFPYPIIADEDRSLSVQLGMIDPDEKDDRGMPLSCRAVFIIGPGDHKVKLSILYPATTGRNFNEVLRVLDSLQLTAEKKVATPADWKSGDKCMVVPSLSTPQAIELFGDVQVRVMPSKKEYMRFTKDPS